MIKHSLLKVGLIIGAVLFLVISSMAPMILGNSTTKLEQDHLLEYLAFICREPNGFNHIKYEHYKLQLSIQCVIEDNYLKSASEPEHTIVQTGTQSASLFFGPVDSAWPMKCHDNYHTGLSQYSTADNPGIEKWRFSENFHGIESSPVIDSDGVIYICDGWGVITAIYSNGTMKWKYTAGGQILGSSPAIDEDDTIYVGCWDSYLYALYRNGTLKWRFFAYDSNICSSPAIAEDGTIYFGGMGPGDYGRIYAVNPNGTEKWYYDTGYLITSDPAIADDGTIYIGSGDTYVYAMYPNGTLRWRFKTGDYVKGPPSITGDGTVYIGSYDDYLYALYPNGTMKWKCNLGHGTETNPSIATDGTIYVGSYDGHLYALYPNGTLKWSFLVIGNVHQSSPAISADGTIYFGTDATGMVYAVNPDGTEKWHKKIADEWVESSPSIAEDGTIYIGSSYDMSRGYLHAFGIVESNEPPTPAVITGKTNGKVGKSYTYTFVSSDPENYPVKYYVDWGDGTNINWTWEYDSNEMVNMSHMWSEKGTYTIRAKAMDISNNESNWGTLSVTMPRPYEKPTMNLLDKLLEWFPNAFPILRYILDYY